MAEQMHIAQRIIELITMIQKSNHTAVYAARAMAETKVVELPLLYSLNDHDPETRLLAPS